MAGQNLVPKDNLMGGMVKGKSDPYVKINVGGETLTSHVIKGNLNPTWNEMYEVNNRKSWKENSFYALLNVDCWEHFKSVCMHLKMCCILRFERL